MLLRRSVAVASACAAVLASGCSRSASELEPAPSGSGPVNPGPSVRPLLWEVPTTWTATETSTSTPRRAVYKVPRAGDDKEDAELIVLFFGTGSQGDPAKNFDTWFAMFDGDLGKTAARETFPVGPLSVDTVEVAGTYKVPMGPTVGPKKRSAMQVIKKDFRMIGAVVKTPDRGNWFFKLTGPAETVQAARSAFRGLLDSAR